MNPAAGPPTSCRDVELQRLPISTIDLTKSWIATKQKDSDLYWILFEYIDGPLNPTFWNAMSFQLAFHTAMASQYLSPKQLQACAQFNFPGPSWALAATRE